MQFRIQYGYINFPFVLLREINLSVEVSLITSAENKHPLKFLFLIQKVT